LRFRAITRDLMPTKAVDWIKPGLLAERLGITTARCRQLADEGVLTCKTQPSGDRIYAWPRCRAEYEDFRVRGAVANALGAAPKRELSLDEARARLATAQAQRQELALAKDQGQVISLKTHLREAENLAARVARAIKQLRMQHRGAAIGLTGATVDAFFDTIEDALFAEMHESFSAGFTESVDDDEPEADSPDRAA
jgi:phage terminase Nu1 subunit (DNA packaging protein)